jgi:phosphoglycolate phosphatase-like HAD superfamily hydrolase
MSRIIIFDFDGTIVDSMPCLADIASGLINRYYGLSSKLSRDLYMLTSGLPFVEQMEYMFPGKKENREIVEEFERKKEDEVMNEPLFPETKEVLAALAGRGNKVVISSSNFQHIMEGYIKECGLTPGLVLGYREGFSKGRDHFNYIKKHFQADTEDLVFVGDSLRDFEKAKDNGVRFIGRVGTFTADDFKEAGADEVIHDLRELVRVL